MNSRTAVAVCLGLLLVTHIASAAEFYVDPNGTAAGDGSAAKPWDFATAMLHPAAVKPGDTLILTGGTYRLEKPENFTTKLAGTAEAPITVKPAAGARATVDLYREAKNSEGSFYLGGAHTIYRDFEFMSSNPDREKRASWQVGAGETGGAAGVKAVNLILHDMSNIGIWRSAVNSEFYGCLIYHNGNNGRDQRGHGHAVYAQNTKGTMRVEENICFNQFSCGVAPHGSMAVVGLKMIGNVCFNNGVLGKLGQRYNFFFWTQSRDSRDCMLSNNFGYVGGYNDEKAYNTDIVNGTDITIEDNYLVGGGQVLYVFDWDKATVRNNRVFGAHTIGNVIDPNAGPGKYDWNGNQYTALGNQANPFSINNKAVSWDQWRQRGLDANGTFSTEKPKEAAVFVRPNRFEEGRANVIIYNWPQTDTVEVDLAPAKLRQGEAFVLLDAQNFFGKPVVEGKWTGKAIRVPMKDLPMEQPTGKSFVPPKHTGVDFGVFVLRKAKP